MIIPDELKIHLYCGITDMRKCVLQEANWTLQGQYVWS